MMTYNELYRQTKQIFAQAGVESPAFDAMCLLQHCFGLDRAGLILHGDTQVKQQEAAQFAALADRRAKGEPLQYILGKWQFMDREFYVGKGVLIPREDTQVTVLQAEQAVQGKPQAQIMDLCAGSGIIAITLAKRSPGSRVWALELSEEAFFYLQKNISLHGTKNVTAVHGDVFKAFRDFADESFDLLVSNPPYVCTETIASLQCEVLYEPFMALDGGADGLMFYRQIIEEWTPLLKHGGQIAFEVGEEQALPVKALLLQNGYTDVRFAKDIAQTDRCVSAIRV